MSRSLMNPFRTRPNPITDDGDGDGFSFCGNCAFAGVCHAEGYDKPALKELHCLVQHVGPYHAGTLLFREGDPFNAIAAVRSGMVKTFRVDAAGREQVLGFFLLGEIIGLDAIHNGRFPCNAVALDTVSLCRFSFPMMATLATRMPGLQTQLFRLLSQDINKAAAMAGDFSADERMAAFVLSISRRFANHGFSPNRFALSMSRTDIGNYLRLAAETVSRVMRRFQNEGLLHVDRREFEILDMARLQQLALPLLRE